MPPPSKTTTSQEHIQVHVRVRPPASGRDTKPGFKLSDALAPATTTTGPDENQYDKVYEPHHSNADVYRDTAHPAVLNFIRGFNGCVMAYGQTGSGKTHTLLAGGLDPGIVPRSLSAVVQELRRRGGADTKAHWVMGISFVEIYNETFVDLLDIDNSPRVRVAPATDGEGGFVLRNACVSVISRADTALESAMRAYDYGSKNRSVGCSSVHGMATVHVTWTEAGTGGRGGSRRCRCWCRLR